jgi:hypothetical protein
MFVRLLSFEAPSVVSQSECKGNVATLSEDVRGFRVLSLLIALMSQSALLYGCKLGIVVAMQLPCHCHVFAMQLPWLLPCMRQVIAMPTINN